MPKTVESSEAATLLATFTVLTPAHQTSLVEYAQFLRQQEVREDEAQVAADEAEWDRLFSDPKVCEKTEAWARKLMAESGAEPLDPARL